MAKSTKPWLVQVEFLDHSKASGNDTGLIMCHVWGILREETERTIVVCDWVTNGDLNNPDSECYTILKHPELKITKIRQISF